MVRALSGALALLLTASGGHAHAAGPYDPDVEYVTLTTPNFHVVAPVGYEHIALRSGRIAEDIFEGMAARYRYRPDGRTTIIINDQTDFANGSATILPNKVVTIFVTAPTEVSGLEDYDDWLHGVIVHEMAHIFHLDMVYDLPWVGRLLLGKYVAMNQYTASWATEGLAVYEETVASGAGRGRSSLVDMYLRTAALEDRFPAIDEAYRAYANWPFGNVVYFFGGRFHLWLAENYGEQAVLRYHQVYAANPVPYLTWHASQVAFNATLESLWNTFAADTLADAQLELTLVRSSSMAMTTPVRLTYHGGQVLGPRVTPDSKQIIYSTSSPVDGPRVRRMPIDGGADQVLLEDTLSKAITFTPKGDAFYFQQTEINQRFYTHNSILRYGIGDRRVYRVQVDEDDRVDYLAPSGSLRARDPDISPDGQRLVFVQTPFGSNQLVLAWLESNGYTIHPKIIVPAEPDVQLSNPRFSPDGQSIAVSRFAGGRRDIVIYDLEGNVRQFVTRDRDQDVDPTWSSDGRWLVFSSDRTSVYNLYAYEVATGTLHQLTNLITGAFQPCVTPDMTRVVYRGYTADGFDVFSVPFSPDSAPAVPVERQPPADYDNRARAWPPLQSNAVVRPPPPAPFTGTPLPERLPDNWAFDDYDPLDTLLPFHDNWNLIPVVFANEREFFGQLSHFGSDALGTHAYSTWINYGTETNFIGGGAVYTNNQLHPTFSIGGELDTRSFPIFDRATRLSLGDFDERRVIGTVGIGLPLRQRHQISFSYTFEDRRPLRDPTAAQASEGFGFPALGRFARVRLGYAYSNVRSFPHSVSLERGWSAALALEGLSKGLGSDYEQFLFTAQWRGYLSMPYRTKWLQNHVLATRLAAAVGGGPDLAERFRLGGVAGSSALTTTTQNFYPLRGLVTSGLSGSAVFAGTVEYRAPIYRFERGLGSAPFTVRTLHAAVFSDFGRVFERFDADALTDRPFDQFAVSAGGELRADVLLGWVTDLQLRLGWAQVLHTPDPTLDTSGLYFQIGSTF